MNKQPIIYYFLIELIVVISISFYGPFFKDLTGMYGLPIAVLLYVILTQAIAISAVLTLQYIKKKSGSLPPIHTDTNSEPEKDSSPLTNVALPVKLPGRSHSATEVQQPLVVESGSAGNPLSVAERSKLKINFELTHPDFFDNRKKQHPYLSNNEIWLLVYYDLKLSTKEIAAILNIDSASVRRAKTRMQRKLRQHGTEPADDPSDPMNDIPESG
ncbi:hypothetical protein DYBT9275_02902 [Dyadobacter sp. CECT 9275]|uniref:Uncharacterized protein n=1 Tax=Dyadobacter helix TaxID=2822344 RepID=A0A916NLS2_9BACT|nr:hypothetical protein [Dyadobacter sp. CECT 9275]CAG5002484.1 hypothetical protein DYBT9275_02902 [Dyadobacter sp. CECT 9275]